MRAIWKVHGQPQVRTSTLVRVANTVSFLPSPKPETLNLQAARLRLVLGIPNDETPSKAIGPPSFPPGLERQVP